MGAGHKAGRSATWTRRGRWSTASSPTPPSARSRTPWSRQWWPTLAAPQAKGADATPVAALKLLTTLRNADIEPTAALLNPADYEQIRTLSGTSPYLSGPPITVGDDGVERLFAIPLIVTPSVPDDTALIADMQSVGVWMRSLQVYVSESRMPRTSRSTLCAILAELRAAFGVLVPAAVGKVTGWD